MATIGFDTHEAVKALTKAGFSETQVESVVSTVRDALGGDLATKSDFQGVKSKIESEIKSLEMRMTLRLGGMMLPVAGLAIAFMKLLG